MCLTAAYFCPCSPFRSSISMRANARRALLAAVSVGGIQIWQNRTTPAAVVDGIDDYVERIAYIGYEPKAHSDFGPRRRVPCESIPFCAVER